MELFLPERYNSFRRVLQSLYEATYMKQLQPLYESEITEKRRGRDLGQFVVFVLAPCCWADNFEVELVSLMKI